MKILAVVSKSYPGVCAVLEHGRHLGLWDTAFLENLKNVDEIKGYDLVILGAYHPGYEQLLNKSQKFVLLWTSSPGQTGFREVDVLKKVFSLYQDKSINELWFGSKEFVEIFKKEENVFHFAYPFSIELIENELSKDKVEHEFAKNNVGFFSPKDPRKNLFVQYHAFVIAQRKNKKLVLHNNVSTDQPSNWIHNYGWIPKQEYFKLLSHCVVSLHVFPFESFCYSAAEAIICGSIPVVSSTVVHNLGLPVFTEIRQVDSPVEISEMIVKLTNMEEDVLEEMRIKFKNSIKVLAKKNNSVLEKFLNSRLLHNL